MIIESTNKTQTFSANVLICEDDVFNQQLLHTFLTKFGINPTIANNGEEGVNAVLQSAKDNNSFELIFMDIHMPKLDGIDATIKLRSLDVNVPIIALTSNTKQAEIESYKKCGMSGFLSKPFFPNDLLDCLKKFFTVTE